MVTFFIGSMGLVYLPTLMVDVYGKCIGKYTSPMDPMGLGPGFVNPDHLRFT